MIEDHTSTSVAYRPISTSMILNRGPCAYSTTFHLSFRESTEPVGEREEGRAQLIMKYGIKIM